MFSSLNFSFKYRQQNQDTLIIKSKDFAKMTEHSVHLSHILKSFYSHVFQN